MAPLGSGGPSRRLPAERRGVPRPRGRAPSRPAPRGAGGGLAQPSAARRREPGAAGEPGRARGARRPFPPPGGGTTPPPPHPRRRLGARRDAGGSPVRCHQHAAAPAKNNPGKRSRGSRPAARDVTGGRGERASRHGTLARGDHALSAPGPSPPTLRPGRRAGSRRPRGPRTAAGRRGEQPGGRPPSGSRGPVRRLG